MSKKTLVLTLKAGDGTADERLFSVGDEPLEIGRSHHCALRAPGDDPSVSGRHARVYWKGDTPWIEDAGSRNGVYRNEKRLTHAVKLEPGVAYGIGGCSLLVSLEDGRHTVKQRQYHQLRFVGGDRDGETVDIVPQGKGLDTAFTMGLDGSCGLQLTDLMVSHRHASILVRPGGDCHIRDEGSRNGTYVNGEKLGTTPRLLKDGDKISIAYFDLQFLDRTKTHADPHPLRKVAILGIALLLVLGGWLAWEYAIPRTEAKDFRARASRASMSGDFTQALAYMDAADTARNASIEQPQNDALRQQILRWQDTWNAWLRVNECLTDGKLREAQLMLDELEGAAYSWTWNDKEARAARDTCLFFRQCIRILTDADEDMQRVEQGKASAPTITERLTKLEAFRKAHGKRLSSEPALVEVNKRLTAFQTRLETAWTGIKRVDAALAALDANDPDFRPLVTVFEKVEADATLPAAVRAHVRLLLPVCRAFCLTQDFLAEEQTQICDLAMVNVRKRENALPLPMQDACARHARLSDARAAFQRRHALLQRVAANLGPMVEAMKSGGITGGEKGDTVAYVTSQKNWNRVLAFDCFEGRFPPASRVDPSGTYDEMLGIEFVYENLRELPKSPGRQNDTLLNFKPQSCAARVLFNQVQTFVGYLDRPECAVFHAGKMQQLYALAKDVLADRDRLSADLKKRAADKTVSERAQLVAGYYAEFFSPDPSYAALRNLEHAFKKFVRQLNTLAEEFESENDPEKHIKIRKQILAYGIPGMEIVRRCWAESEE